MPKTLKSNSSTKAAGSQTPRTATLSPVAVPDFASENKFGVASDSEGLPATKAVDQAPRGDGLGRLTSEGRGCRYGLVGQDYAQGRRSGRDPHRQQERAQEHGQGRGKRIVETRNPAKNKADATKESEVGQETRIMKADSLPREVDSLRVEVQVPGQVKAKRCAASILQKQCLTTSAEKPSTCSRIPNKSRVSPVGADKTENNTKPTPQNDDYSKALVNDSKYHRTKAVMQSCSEMKNVAQRKLI